MESSMGLRGIGGKTSKQPQNAHTPFSLHKYLNNQISRVQQYIVYMTSDPYTYVYTEYTTSVQYTECTTSAQYTRTLSIPSQLSTLVLSLQHQLSTLVLSLQHQLSTLSIPHQLSTTVTSVYHISSVQ